MPNTVTTRCKISKKKVIQKVKVNEQSFGNVILLCVQGGGGQTVPRDFPQGNFWRLIGKKEGRKKGKKMENVEEIEEKIEKGRRKMRKN